MKTCKTALLTALFALSLPCAAQAQFWPTTPLYNDAGKEVGSINVAPMKDGLHISLQAHDLPPGAHGFHVHAVGDCSDHADHFKKSGGHYSRPGQEHGFQNAKGPHAGDLPNITVAADGTVKAQFVLTTMTVDELYDKDGSAFMIHAKADDYISQPAGDAGERLACGAYPGTDLLLKH